MISSKFLICLSIPMFLQGDGPLWWSFKRFSIYDALDSFLGACLCFPGFHGLEQYVGVYPKNTY
jgi:hypothetical protein